MTLEFNVNGKDRKNLVEAVSTLLETPAKYLGAPSFAYQVGEYHIDKNGTLSGIANDWLVDALYQNGFRAGERTYNAHDVEEETDFGDEIAEPEFLTIEMPRTGFTEDKLENLRKMIISKEELIKAAFDIDLLVYRIAEDYISFPWFRNKDGITSEEVTAYGTFLSLLCETAKEKKRVTAKAGELPTNPKFAFRCWLLSLGMIGDEYKLARKILLSKLSGSSAWRNGAPTKA